MMLDKRVDNMHFWRMILVLLLQAVTTTRIVLGQDASSVITSSILASHNSADDCWISYSKRVFDLTTYRHPKNIQSVITNGCGTDDSENFFAIHPLSYLDSISSRQVGILSDEVAGTPPSPQVTQSPNPPRTVPPETITDSTDGAIETSEPSTGVISPIYTLFDLALHDSPEDCLVGFHGLVYDMTTYAPTHPGPGASVIYNVCGKDGTRSYSIYHKESLLSSVQPFVVGSLDASSSSSEQKSQTDQTETPSGRDIIMDGITLEELQGHSSDQDCWICYFGQVFDMTHLAHVHPIPPGPTGVLAGCGVDHTWSYSKFHDPNLLYLLDDVRVGTLVGIPDGLYAQYSSGDDDAYKKIHTIHQTLLTILWLVSLCW